MAKPTRRVALAGALLAGLATVPPPIRAQGAPQLRLRGRIRRLDGDVLTIDTREGTEAVVHLPATVAVSALSRVALTELTPGTPLGVVAEPSAEGLRAVAVTVLPPTATRQFQSEWDLTPGSSMNNGTVAGVMQRAEGQILTLSINGRDVPVRLDAGTALVRPVPAGRDDLKPGAAVLVAAARAEGDRLVASRISVEKDGVAPPT